MIIGYASPHLLNAAAEKTCYINHMEEWREGEWRGERVNTNAGG